MIAKAKEKLTDALRDEVPALVERLDKIHKDWAEWYGWYFSGDMKLEKMLPYRDWHTFRRLQKTGQLLYYQSTTCRSVHEKLESYIVGKGHKYTVSPIEDETPGDGVLKSIKRIVKEFTETQLWGRMQYESVRRFFREGETYRRPRLKADNKIKIQFIEPVQVQQPSGVELGELGVITEDGDPSEPLGYWVHNTPSEIGDTRPEFFDKLTVAEDRVQHIKGGVDANDPRGIPLFWSVYRDALEVDEISNAAVRLGVTQSEHAAIYTYEAKTAARKIADIADAIKQGREHQVEVRSGARDADDRPSPTKSAPEPGAVHHAKNYEVDVPGANYPADQYIQMVQAKKRDIASLADMPEFMVSGDAETGNRSSLVSAEGPFDRRVKREQGWLIESDVEILWYVVQIQLQLDDSALLDLRRQIAIRAEGPEAAARDPQMISEMVINEVAAKLQSRRGGMQVLERDPEKVMQEIRQEQEEDLELNKELFGNELTFMPDGSALPPEPAVPPQQERRAA